jgi:ankyrin repeat protein
VEAVKVLVELGASVLAQDAARHTPLYFAEDHRHEAEVSFLKKNAQIMLRRPKPTPTPAVDPAARFASKVAAVAMAAFFLATARTTIGAGISMFMIIIMIIMEEDQKQALPSEQGNSNKAQKHKN